MAREAERRVELGPIEVRPAGFDVASGGIGGIQERASVSQG